MTKTTQRGETKPTNWHSVGEVAAILGCSAQHVRDLIYARRLNATNIAVDPSAGKPAWRVSHASIVQFTDASASDARLAS